MNAPLLRYSRRRKWKVSESSEFTTCKHIVYKTSHVVNTSSRVSFEGAIRAQGSKFKAQCYDEVVCPNCMHTECNSTYFVRAAAVY